MGISNVLWGTDWKNVSNLLSGGGRDDVNEGYDKAREYLNPYSEAGLTDYNQFRGDNSAMRDRLNRFGNAGDRMYGHINQSPNEYYNEIMGGYSESPEAKYLTEQANKASTYGASASGMMGSGAFQKGLQENASRIAENDRQRYFGNVMGVDQRQMDYLGNLQNQQQIQRQIQEYLTNMGFNARSGLAGNEIGRANANAQFDQGAFNDIAGIAGAVASGGMGGGGMGGIGGGGRFNQGVPEYMRKSIYGMR